jgi:hypothetical protein
MDRSDDARIPPMADGQEINTSSSSTLEAMPPSEEPTSLPTADPQPSPAQPIFPNRHLSDDERGTSSKYPEVKGDGAWPPAPDPLARSLARPAVHQHLILTPRLSLTTTTVTTFNRRPRLPGEPQRHVCMEGSDLNLRAEIRTTSS